MCGRFVFTPGNKKKFQERFEFDNDVKIENRYNFAPGQILPVIIRQSPNQAVPMKWGLVPFWAKDPGIGYKMINARAESIAEKPSFKKAFRSQRCLVPTNGFYEWKRSDGKTPYYIHRQDKEMLAFAGLYDTWKDAEGKEFQTFTIITTTPNKLMAPIHNRMPVILNRENENTWLKTDEASSQKLLNLLKPAPTEEFEAYPISTRVNKATNDDPSLLTPTEQKSLL